MRSAETRNTTKDWVRLAAKLSLLFTEPKIRRAISEKLKDSVDDMTDTVTSKYDDLTDAVASQYDQAVDRLEAASAALRGRSYRSSQVTGFLLGVGIGAGLGILLAPASGRETRESVRDKAAEMKNRVFESAASVTGKMRQSVADMTFTGTEG
jgi:gas vesicle protein